LKFRIGNDRIKSVVTFNSILPELIEDLDLKDSYLIQELSDKWKYYVGNILAVHSQPDRIFKKTLFVNTDHSVYLNELSLQVTSILKKINDDYGKGFIKTIKFNVKNLNWKK